MICPQCRAEYREGFTVCADCEVELVPGEAALQDSQQALVPVARSEFESESEDSDEDPFCKFWAGNDPRIHAELCLILEEERIPYRTIRREDRLFHFTVKAPLMIGIPASFFEKAEAAIGEAYGTQGDEWSHGLLPGSDSSQSRDDESQK
jgi:hypothetical protein